MEVYAQLLGAPQLRLGHSSYNPPPTKASALLYHLAFKGEWCSRDELIYLFYPDTAEDTARRNLRQLLTSIRRLPYSESVEIEATRLRWSIRTDTQAFRRAISEQHWAQTVELYQGKLLQGVTLGDAPEFEAWLELEREELHGQWRDAVLALAKELEGSRRYPQAGESLEKLYKSDSVDEEVLQRYLRALYLGGQRNKALAVFASFKKQLQEEYDGEPEAETFSLIEWIERNEKEPHFLSSSATRASEDRQEPSHNLPAQPTPFVGREAEKEGLSQLLRNSSCRLLTIVGPGGIGKTRLAIEAARVQLASFQDGVCFVNFVPVASPELMVYAIASALGFSFYGPQEPKEQLLDYLKNKEILLALDNLEHLLSGIQLVSGLLEHAPHIKLLATSRERLNLQAEWVYDLYGLEVPEAANQDAQDCDAIRLFTQRASSARHDFGLDDSTLPVIIHICQLVRGMPLAIELAASWLRALTLEEIAVEIEKGIFFLEASARDIPARHRSIRAVFDYSWKLLTEEEQPVLRKLSMCQGGFRREAAAEIAGANLSILASLVDKSFLTITPTGRYRRHPLVIQYMQEKLAEHPEEKAQTEERHGLYYLRFVRERERDLRTRKRKATLTAIEEELPNIRAAWSWAIANQQVDEIKASVLALGEAYRNRMPEGVKLFAQAVAGLDESDPSHHAALGCVLVQQAQYSRWLTPGEKVMNCVQHGLELLRPLGEVQGITRGLHALGVGAYWTAYLSGDLAQANLQEALALAREHGDSSEISECLWGLAMAARESGSFPQVKRFFEAALAEVQDLGDVVGFVRLQHQLGAYLVHNGFFQEGYALMQESLALAREVDERVVEVFNLDDLALAAYKLGKYEEAEALAFETLKVAEELNMKEPEVKATAKLGRVATARGHYLEAERYLKESLQLTRIWEYAHHHAVLEAIILLAELAIAQGRALEAARWLGLVRHQPTFLNEHKLELQHLLEALQNQLVVEELEQALEQGKSLRLEEVVGELLEGGPALSFL